MFQVKFAERIKIHVLYLVTFFPKIASFMRYVEKNVVGTNRRWKYGGALHPGFRKATRAQAHANACTPTPTPTIVHARTLSHTQIRNAYCFSRQRWFHERVSMLRYTYIVCLGFNRCGVGEDFD